MSQLFSLRVRAIVPLITACKAVTWIDLQVVKCNVVQCTTVSDILKDTIRKDKEKFSAYILTQFSKVSQFYFIGTITDGHVVFGSTNNISFLLQWTIHRILCTLSRIALMTGFSHSVLLWCVSILMIFECNMPPTCLHITEIIVEDEMSQSSPI